MAHPPNHTFSKPVEMHQDEEFERARARLFTQDRRYNALDVNTGQISGSHVVTVTDEPLSDWGQVAASAATSILSGVPGVPSVMLHGAYIRSALRGAGRDRWR